MTPGIPEAGGGGHTPGPWVTYDDSALPSHRHTVIALGKTIAYIYCTKGDEAQDASNAKLIAAAPELLEEAKRALECIIRVDQLLHANGMMVGVTNPVIPTLTAAIAKATQS